MSIKFYHTFASVKHIPKLKGFVPG